MVAKKAKSKSKKGCPVNIKKISLPIILGVIAVTGIYFLSTGDLLSKKTSSTVPTSTITEGEKLTTAVVAKHNTEADCWVVIENKAYNVTELISAHSGGPKNVSNYCGKDATAAWNTKNKTVAKIHSALAKTKLENYLVGSLK